MSRLTRDGTAEPVSRDQILRRSRVLQYLSLDVDDPPVYMLSSITCHVSLFLSVSSCGWRLWSQPALLHVYPQYEHAVGEAFGSPFILNLNIWRSTKESDQTGTPPHTAPFLFETFMSTPVKKAITAPLEASPSGGIE